MFKTADILDRLRSIGREVSPEEQKILGITPEDLNSFKEKQSPDANTAAVIEIIREAYKKPQFKELLRKDLEEGSHETARLISNFLKHIRKIAPPENSNWISSDTFKHALGLIKQALPKASALQEPVKQEEPKEKVEDLTSDQLELFDLKPADLKGDPKSEKIEDAIAFFLGKKLINVDGKKKRVKNPRTEKLPVDSKKILIHKLLNQARDAKMKAKGKLSPMDERWLGGDLERRARLWADPPKKEKYDIRQSDPFEVLGRQSMEAVTSLNRILDVIESDELKSDLENITKQTLAALPTPGEVKSGIAAIQQEADKLGLSKYALSMLLNVDDKTMTLEPLVTKDYMSGLAKEEKEIMDKGEEISDKDKSILAEIAKKRKTVEAFSNLNLKPLMKAAESYIEMLNKYQEGNKDRFNIKSDSIKSFNALSSNIQTLTKVLRNLAKEDVFRSKWKRSGDMFFNPQKDTEEPSTSKVAASLSDYSEVRDEFGASDVSGIIEKLDDLFEGAGVSFLRNKILSILEAKPNTKINPTSTDYSDNPLAGKGPSVEEVFKDLSKIDSAVRKISFKKKGPQASSILSWLSDLPQFIKPAKSKKAYDSYDIVTAEEGTKKKMAPPGSKPRGQGSKYFPSSDAGWLIHQTKMTPMGKKYLKNFFDKPDFVKNFVEQMEKKGLNKMNLAGGSLPEKAIDEVVESIISKGSGEKGGKVTLDNFLGNQARRLLETKREIGKGKSDLASRQEEVRKVNQEIVDLETEYIPKIEKMVEFFSDAFGKTKELIEKKKEEPKSEKTDIEPESEPSKILKTFPTQRINLGNYQSAIEYLLSKYSAADSSKKEAAADTLAIPSTQLRSTKETLQKLEEAKSVYEKIKDPLKRAKKVKDYYDLFLGTHSKNKKYLEAYSDQLQEDMSLAKKILDFLKNEEAIKEIKPKVLARAKDKAQQAVKNVAREFDVFKELSQDHNDRNKLVDSYRKGLQKIEDDIKDGEVELLYDVATAPEMDPSEEDLQDIKTRQKAKGKMRGQIDDIATYKRVVNHLTSQLIKKPGVKRPDSDTDSFVLPSERLREFKNAVDRDQRIRDRLSDIQDEWKRNNQERIALSGLVKNYEDIKNKIPKMEKTLEEFKSSYESVTEFLRDQESKSQPEISAKELSGKRSELNELKDKLKIEASNLKTLKDHFDKLESEDTIEKHKERIKELDGLLQRDKEKRDIAIKEEKGRKILPSEEAKELNDLLIQNEKFQESLKSLRSDWEKEKKEIELLKQTIAAYEKAVSSMPDLEKSIEKIKSNIANIESSIKRDKSTLTPEQLGGRQELLKKQQASLAKEVKALEDIKKLLYKDIKGKSILDRSKDRLAELEGKPSLKTAAAPRADKGGDMKSPEELALERAKAPAYERGEGFPIKPRNWEIVEDFFDQSKKKIKVYETMKDVLKSKGDERRKQLKSVTPDMKKQVSEDLKNIDKRVEHLKKMLSGIDAYKNQIVKIHGESFPLAEGMERLHELMSEYQSKLAKLEKRRESLAKETTGLTQKIRGLEEFIDPETGEFRDFTDAEKQNMRDIFFRKLYRAMDSYWGSHVGQNVNVFGPRDAQWYNNVYNTFKNIVGTKSNRKLMNLLNKYKEETRSDFGDDFHRMKSEALQKQKDDMEKRLIDLGADPTRSQALKDLQTRINNLKANEEQINKVFDAMSGAVQAELHKEVEEGLKNKVKEVGVEDTSADLDKKVEEKVQEAEQELGGGLNKIIDTKKEVDDIISILDQADSVIKERASKKKKEATYKEDKNFNMSILYSENMQKVIAGMIQRNLEKLVI